MIQKIYGIRDAKSQAFLQPFYSVNPGSAIRAFGDAVNENLVFKKHPEDYILYELGEFDDNTGEFTSYSPLRMLGVGSDFIAVKPASPIDQLMKEVGDGAQKVG